jgi:hypothetical protein
MIRWLMHLGSCGVPVDHIFTDQELPLVLFNIKQTSISLTEIHIRAIASVAQKRLGKFRGLWEVGDEGITEMGTFRFPRSWRFSQPSKSRWSIKLIKLLRIEAKLN